MCPFYRKMIIMENAKTKENKSKEINEPLYLLIMELTKKIINLDRKVNKLLEMQSAVNEDEKNPFTSLNHQLDKQFGNVDSLLGRYFQKFTRDNNRIFERLNDMQKSIDDINIPSISHQSETGQTKIDSKISPPAKLQTRDFVKTVPVKENFSIDKNEINELRAFFSHRNIFTTGALKIIEETRDKLLFERDTEAPYRAFAAKIFREILSIVKSEKDFSTLSNQATQDIIHRIDLIQERIG